MSEKAIIIELSIYGVVAVFFTGWLTSIMGLVGFFSGIGMFVTVFFVAAFVEAVVFNLIKRVFGK